MRLPRRRLIAAQINMTPMIDVTFQLIIFFLLSSRLAQQESTEFDLPTAASGAAAADGLRPHLAVSITPDGRVRCGSDEVAPGDLVGRLKTERNHRGADVEVRIRADRIVPYRVVEPVLLACADANIWNVTFAVVERAENQMLGVEPPKP